MSGHAKLTAQEKIDLISRGIDAAAVERCQADLVYVVNGGIGGSGTSTLTLGTFSATSPLALSPILEVQYR